MNFTRSSMAHYYRIDPTQFTREVLEGLANGVMSPGQIQIRDLAEAIMGREWVDWGCNAPRGASGVPFDGREATPFSGSTGESGNVTGGEFSDTDMPNPAATRGFMRNGKANVPLLEQFVKSRKNMPRKLLESGAVKHTDFANITGQIIFTAIMEPYTMEEFIFSKMIPSRQSDFLDVEKVAGTTGIGNVFDEPIKEGDPYPMFGVSENFRHIAPKQKRGGIVRVTKEAVKGNRTGDLLSQCNTIGKGLGAYTENAGIDAIVDEGTMAKSALEGGHRYHWKNASYATYQTTSPWANVVTSNGLTNDQNIDAARQSFLALLDPFTNEEIEINPTEVLVHYNKELQAKKILQAFQVRGGDITSGDGTQILSPNIIVELVKNLQVYSSRRFSNRIAASTDWWLSNIRELVERVYVWDLLPEQFGGGTYDDIYTDVVQIIKVSKMDCYSVKEPRASVESRA